MRRRDFLFSSAALALAGLPGLRAGHAATQRIRHNAASTEGKAMLRVFADAVKAMKALPARDPRSWTFQWYIHATPSDRDELIEKTFSGTDDTYKALAVETWYTCQAHQRQPIDYFLPWHRLYLIQFEAIVASLTGRMDFALPYWDYTSPASYAIPDEFQHKHAADPAFASLFVEARNKGGDQLQSADINAGEPVNKHYTGAQNFLALPEMELPYTNFSATLDQGLHRSLHIFVGDRTGMGRIPTAASDPLFWLHHSAIDRIWAGWNHLGGKNPTETGDVPWIDTKFVFAGVDGKRVEFPISSISENQTLPYRYDSLPSPSPDPLLVSDVQSIRRVLQKSLAPGNATASIAPPGDAPAIRLDASTTLVRLAPTAPQNRLLAIAPARGGGKPRIRLKLRGVQTAADPLVVYKLFLDLPPDATSDAADAHFVGLLQFFGLELHSTGQHAGHHVGHHAGHGNPSGTSGEDFEFDVTDLVLRLYAGDSLRGQTTVTLQPSGAPTAGSLPQISGGIELQE